MWKISVILVPSACGAFLLSLAEIFDILFCILETI